uniref:Uncharacterized protein n=1 Tax=Arundo donax TaxID=35708 RepID=A0A0A9B4J1_ARUDO
MDSAGHPYITTHQISFY